MKKIFPSITILIFLFSCSKIKNDFAQPKLKSRLSQNDIQELESKYAGLKFNASYLDDTLYHRDSLRHFLINRNQFRIFKDKIETAQFIDSLKQLLTTSFQTNEVLLNVNHADTLTNNKFSNKVEMECKGNLKVNHILSDGAFSSFTASFTFDGTNVSNFSLSLMGTTIGWWWNSGNTFTNGSFGTTEGTATYFYGLFTYSTPYKLTWALNPTTCAFTYNWDCEVTKAGLNQNLQKTDIIFPGKITKDTTKSRIILPVHPIKNL